MKTLLLAALLAVAVTAHAQEDVTVLPPVTLHATVKPDGSFSVTLPKEVARPHVEWITISTLPMHDTAQDMLSSVDIVYNDVMHSVYHHTPNAMLFMCNCTIYPR